MNNASILEVDRDTAFERMRIDLRVNSANQTDPLAVLCAAVLRRLAGFMCPCPPFALIRAAKRSLAQFEQMVDDLDYLIEETIEDLVACGDLLELSRVVIAGAEDKPTWLFCALPSFVERQSSRVYLFGVAPDDASFLPGEIREKIQYHGATRYIEATDTAKVCAMLVSIGLRSVASSAWLTHHQPENPTTFVDRFIRRLARHGSAGDLPDLKILSHLDASGISYRGRWTSPGTSTGLFIGRAPQPYGEPRWYLCDIQNGQTVRSLLLPLPELAMRACDQAWQIQLAIDARNGNRDIYRVALEDDGYRLDFMFPLPMAARRRINFLGGGRRPKSGGGLSFYLPASQLDEEKTFLELHYWLHASLTKDPQ